MTRVIIFVFVLICSTVLVNKFKALSNFKEYYLAIAQTIYFIFIIILRPSEKIEANIILLLNEFVFWILSCLLVYYNTQDRWNNTVEEIYLRIISSNSIATTFIIFGNILHKIYSYNCDKNNLKKLKQDVKEKKLK